VGTYEPDQPRAFASPGQLTVLVADDEPLIVEDLSTALRTVGHRVLSAFDGEEALSQVRSRDVDLVLCDVRLPAIDGLTLLHQVRAEAPQTDVVLMSGYATVPDAVAAMKADALDYLCKPFDQTRLLTLVALIGERRRLLREAAQARSAAGVARPGVELIGQSAVMVRLRERLAAFAGASAPVLLLGESGTGKELAARLTHQLSPRRDESFVALNCAAFPDSLLESELFGHVRGAFTGAVRDRKGQLYAADQGTLFLDEIAELSAAAQAKLLRVLQEGVYSPVGSDSTVSVNVRLVSATNQDLRRAIAQGRFREDLYFRIKVLDAHLPPLSARAGDLPILVEHMLRRFTEPSRTPPRLSPRAWAALAAHRFPGNVRELEHAVRYALVLSRGADISLEHLPDDIRGTIAIGAADPAGGPLPLAVDRFERELIVRALVACGGRRAEAAKHLGISRKHLWHKIRAHQIDEHELASG
jgi:DNA-binding NtrC family response regulator